jgi:photosystem II stability/assembly factor-like uncharacterized protein
MNWAIASSGFTGAYVLSLAIDPASPTTLYAGTYGGVFKSVDGGANWAAASVGLTSTYSAALAIDPLTPTTLYVGTSGGGVFKSVDAGASWSATGLATGSVNALAIDPANPATLYAGGSMGILMMKSVDGGANWSAADGGLFQQPMSIAIDPAASSTVYAGTNNRLYRSLDAGLTWAQHGPGDWPSLGVRSVAIHASNVYMGASGGVFRSMDSGANWAMANTGLTNSTVRALVIDPVSPSTVYAGIQAGGIFKSNDAGMHWSAVNTGLTVTDIRALTMDPSTPTTLYAGTWSGGIYKSVNGGASWTPSNSGMTTFTVLALAINPAAPAVLYAATNIGVFKSTNGGAAWLPASTGLPAEYVYSLAIDPTSPSTLYAGLNSGGIYKSTDAGASWTVSRSGGEVAPLVVDSAATVYAAERSVGLLKSTDGGASWVSAQPGLPAAPYALAIDPTTPSTLYAGASDGVFKSVDGGAHWSAAKTGLANIALYSLAVDPVTPTTIYAGTLGSSVFKSTNGAVSSESRLLDLALAVGGSPVAMTPPFSTGTLNYAATVQGAASATLTPTAWINDATIAINGVPIASGGTSAPVALDPGANTFIVAVTSGDATSTSTYTVTVIRQVIAPAAPTSVQAALGAPGSGQATVSWTPSASSGSSALAGYTVNGGSGCTAGPGDSSCVVSGLVDGTAYTFTVTAANTEGGTAISSISNSVTPMASCTFNGMPVLHGGSVTAYAQFSVPFGNTCQQQTRTCSNGALSGSYAYATCSVSAAASCTFNGQPVAHGQSVTAYLNAAEPAGGSCTAESRSCSNGTLSGSHTHAACQVAPGAPTDVQAVPTGSGQVTVTWQAPADTGSGITGYVVTAQPGGQTCVPNPATATSCTFAGLPNGQTQTFAVEATNGAGSTTSAIPSNPATPLADPKAFSAPSPTGTGTVDVAVAGGGGTCAFESVQLVSAASAGAPATRSFPHGVLDFVLHACDATPATVTVTYPPGTPLQGAQYWKRQGGTWAPFAGAVLGANTAVLTLTDGGAGDDDGVPTPNGRIVDPGGISVLAAAGGAAPIPTLGEWALALLAVLLGLLAWRRQRHA